MKGLAMKRGVRPQVMPEQFDLFGPKHTPEMNPLLASRSILLPFLEVLLKEATAPEAPAPAGGDCHDE